jgi:diketogulonate reductase-like aldo/keto reductase
MEQYELNNGTTIPSLGLGTFTIKPDDAENAVNHALQDGYRMIDTANIYMNEKAVGRGMKKSGIARNEIYLSTKLWPSVYSKASQAIDETLKRLDTDYIDLLFLHQPSGDVLGAWHAMEQAVRDGKVKSLGLSDFSRSQIQEVLDHCEIKPAVLQIEAHPYFDQAAMSAWLKPYGIRIMSWYPLGHGDHTLIEEPVFTSLAEKYHKSNAQIILRWHIQMGFIVIPGSKNPEHIQDNLNIFDFELTADDMRLIATIHKNKSYLNIPGFVQKAMYLYRPNFNHQK